MVWQFYETIHYKNSIILLDMIYVLNDFWGNIWDNTFQYSMSLP